MSPPLPNLPAFFDMSYTDSSGKMTPDSYLYNDQTFQNLNASNNLLNNIATTSVSGGSVTIQGIMIPSYTTTQINVLASSASVGSIWYNNTIDKLVFKGASVIQTISSS